MNWHTIKYYPYKRAVRFFFQRLTRGWDDSDTWSMDHTLASVMLPRLKRFKEVNRGCPIDLSTEEWNSILDRMIDAFEFYASQRRFNCLQQEFDDAQIGLDLFAKWYGHLWW